MPAPTHFLCIPLAGPQLARSWAAFRADVTGPGCSVVPEGAVRPLGTLHLTLGVMSLTPDAVDRAAQVLASLRPRAVLDELEASRATEASSSSSPKNDAAARRPAVTLQGLRPMQAASKTTVLYAPPVDPEGLLVGWCERLRAPFREQGLMEDDGRPLLLHATVVNTIYVKRAPAAGGGTGKGRRRERVTMDARALLDRYGDFVWARDLGVTKLAICRMGAKPVEGSDGDAAYEVEAEIDV